jgi:hypothetical protein
MLEASGHGRRGGEGKRVWIVNLAVDEVVDVGAAVNEYEWKRG